MKKILTVIFLVLYAGLSYAQEPIRYVLPDRTEAKIEKYLKKRFKKWPLKEGERIFFFILNGINGDLELKVQVLPKDARIIEYQPGMDLHDYYNKCNLMNNCALKSNRVMLVGNKEYPIVFDFDVRFGTITPISEMGEYGNRGGILRCFSYGDEWAKRIVLMTLSDRKEIDKLITPLRDNK